MLVFSPKLLNLLTDPEFLVSRWQPLLEIQFNAPKLNNDFNNLQLSIGTVLSVACFLTRVLSLVGHNLVTNISNTKCSSQFPILIPQQSFAFHEEPLNDISQINPEETCDWQQSSSIPAADRTERTTYNKSTSLSLSTSTALPAEILSNLDEKICFTALEYVMTLLASQSLLALKDANLSNRNKQLIKRELSTELHIFHDWVKKTLRIDLNKTPLHRKKYGLKMMSTVSTHDTTITDRSAPHPRVGTDLFFNKHLSVAKGSGFTSTPIGPKPKSVPMEQSRDVDTTYTIDKEAFNGLSMVKIVEEDYVHFLSNIFTLICH